MNESAKPIPGRLRGIFRAGLLALGAVQLINGLYALLAPRSFYDDFPFGRGWVAGLPEYSEHLVRDVGGLFLATAVVLIAAGIFLERRLILVALISFLAFSLPHTVFHLFNLEPYAIGDVIANLIALGATVLIPVGLLYLLARSPAPSAPPPSPKAAAPGSGNGRIAGVGDDSRNPFIRYAFWESRRYGEGRVLDPTRVYAHHPKLLFGYGMLELATERSHQVPERLKLLAELRAAMLGGCEWCLDYGSALAAAEGIPEEDLRALPDYAESDRFDDRERLVLDYATAMSQTPVAVGDELFARLAEHFDEAQLVELTSLIALENYRARFNWAFGLAGQGYGDATYCVRPASAAADPGAVPVQ